MPRKKNQQQGQDSQLINAAVNAILSAVDSYNRVYGDYKTETTILLLSNAWELMAKAVLVKRGESIYQDHKKDRTISCDDAIVKLVNFGEIEKDQSRTIHQIVSLRNDCAHQVLPPVPEEIQQQLLFYGCKFFKEICKRNFPKHAKRMNQNFLSLSFSKLTTYSEKVQHLVGQVRSGSKNDKKLVWLLERGIRYADRQRYISQHEFEKLYKGKKKIMPHLKIGNYLEHADMVRVLPIQAPKNYTVDVIQRKGSNDLKGALPVTIKKTKVDDDYPFLTKEIAKKVNKSPNFIAWAMLDLGLKGDDRYHQFIRTSEENGTRRYSQAALSFLTNFLKENPDYVPPYKKSSN